MLTSPRIPDAEAIGYCLIAFMMFEFCRLLHKLEWFHLFGFFVVVYAQARRKAICVALGKPGVGWYFPCVGIAKSEIVRSPQCTFNCSLQRYPKITGCLKRCTAGGLILGRFSMEFSPAQTLTPKLR